MGIHRPMERHLFTANDAVKTAGGSLNLAKGQLAFVDTSKTTPDGAKVVSSFAGKPKNDKVFELRVGVSDARLANRSRSNKAMSTVPFSLNEVKALRVETPGVIEQKVDEVIVGWDGITPGSEFKFQTGDYPFQIAVEVTGDPVGYMGGGANTEIAVVRVEIPDCDPLNTCVDCDGCSAVDCKAVTMEAVERLRRKQVAGGLELQELMEITPVFECDNDVTATLIPYTWWTLELCDTGSDNALAQVASQYDVPVKLVHRVGSTSTYEMLLPDSEGAPADFEQGIASVIKGCATCPDTFTATPEGLLYAFTIEDDGADLTATIEGLPNYVADTAAKSGNNYGVGYYTALFSEALTDEDITAFLEDADENATATVEFVSTVKALCENDTVNTFEWVEGDTCNAITRKYRIILPDADCGQSRLAELQSTYPNLVITRVSGTNCSAIYETTVVSNLVCEECSDIFKDYYVTEAPVKHDNTEWTIVADATASPSGNCKCGIRFKAKTMRISPEEALRGNINFLETSSEIRVSAMYPEEIREGIGRIPEGALTGKYISRKQDRTMLGGLLRSKEAESIAYFLGENPNSTYIKKLLNGGLSVIENDFQQYIHYTLTIATAKNAGGFGNVSSSDLSYSIWVPIGKHAEVEAVLNDLAAHAGVDPVKAY